MATAFGTVSYRARDVARHSQRAGAYPTGDFARLHLGDPDFDTPPPIVAAMTEALRAGYTHYAAPQGDPELRDAIADHLAARFGTSYSTSDIVITASGSAAIGASILATIDAGDEVVIPDPNYSLYADTVRLAGGTPVFVDPAEHLRIDLGRVREGCRSARMLVLCNPCNPTGMVLTSEEIDAIGEILVENPRLLLLVDEAYEWIVFGGVTFRSALTLSDVRDRVLYCQTFSKTYAMTGWRLGYVATSSGMSRAVAQMHRTVNGAVNTAVQRAAIVAIQEGGEWADARRAVYQRRRDLLVAGLSAIPGLDLVPPQGSFYTFPAYEAPLTAAEMVKRAVAYGVCVRSGSEFGPAGEGHIRVAFCVGEDELRVGVQRLTLLFSDLRGGSVPTAGAGTEQAR